MLGGKGRRCWMVRIEGVGGLGWGGEGMGLSGGVL